MEILCEFLLSFFLRNLMMVLEHDLLSQHQYQILNTSLLCLSCNHHIHEYLNLIWVIHLNGKMLSMVNNNVSLEVMILLLLEILLLWVD